LSIAGQPGLCCTAPPVEEKLPETIEPCLEDPDFLTAREYLFNAITNMNPEDLDGLLTIDWLLFEHATSKNFNIGVSNEDTGELDCGLEGYVRNAWEESELPILARSPAKTFYSEFCIGIERTHVLIEELPPEQRRAVYRYAYALRLEGLNEEYYRNAHRKRPTFKLQLEIEALHESYQRIIASV